MRRALLGVVLCCSGAKAQALSKLITLDQAVALTRQNQPQLRQARAQTEAADARADIARSPLLPQVNLNLGYSRRTNNFVATPGTVPTSAGTGSGSSFSSVDFFSSGITANQLVWDFGQTLDRYRATQVSAQAQADTERSTFQRSLYTVRNSFFNARAQKALLAVAKETLESQQRHFAQIEGFVRVGTRPSIDLAQAKTDLANAKLQLINAQTGYESAKAILNQAMGVERDTAYDVSDETLEALGNEDAALEALLKEGLDARPEYASIVKQVRAQELTLSSVRGNYFPAIGVSAGVTDNGRALTALTWNMNAGATLSWNLFAGLGTNAQVREATANLSNLQAQVDLLRQQVRLDISQAQLAVQAAKASLVAAKEVLVAARERLRLSEGRYQTGVGNVIELGDAQVAVTSAAAQSVQAEYRLAAARAQLLLSLGQET